MPGYLTPPASNASGVAFVASGNLSADTVQEAIEELDTEKADFSYVDTTVSNLVDSAPAALDTLNELSAALGDDDNFATTISNQIGTKADKSVTINDKTSSYTLSLGDAGELITVDSASSSVITIPTNAAVAFPVGSIIGVLRLGTGEVTIQGDTGVTVNSSSGTSPQIWAVYAAVQCYKVSTDAWVVIGGVR